MEKAGFKEDMGKADHKKFIFTELDRNFLVFFLKAYKPTNSPSSEKIKFQIPKDSPGISEKLAVSWKPFNFS